jgi:hypothetical protein
MDSQMRTIRTGTEARHRQELGEEWVDLEEFTAKCLRLMVKGEARHRQGLGEEWVDLEECTAKYLRLTVKGERFLQRCKINTRMTVLVLQRMDMAGRNPNVNTQTTPMALGSSPSCPNGSTRKTSLAL